jgi:hypothetical protein
MALFHNSAITGASGNQGGGAGYQISRSLRFNSADSAYLSRTPASAGNRKTWTWAGWVKRSALSGEQKMIAWGTPGTSEAGWTFQPGNTVEFYQFTSGYQFQIVTTQVFRDPSAWLHICIAVDTTQATASNRIRLYVNGTEITTFSTASYPSQNFDTLTNSTSHAGYIGGLLGQSSYFNGYLADVHLVDGQALTPTSFGEFSATTGVWMPKAFSGGSYGSQGWHLDFADNSNNTATTLGKDTSGNGNNWTPNNLSVTAGAGNDSLVDVPTNGSEVDTGSGGQVRGNYATLNPLSNAYTLSNGNLDVSSNVDSNYVPATIQLPTSGKYYFEYTCTNTAGSNRRDVISVVDTSYAKTYPGGVTNSVIYLSFNGGVYLGPSGTLATTYSSWTNGDTVSCAIDCDTGKIWFAKNGTFNGSPSAGTSPATTLTNNGRLSFAVASDANSTLFSLSGTANFGQRPFAYTAPSGFKALCTANLPAPVVTKPSDVMDVKLYTGNGSTQTISGLGFSPDLVWVKGRSTSARNRLFNVLSGVQKELYSDLTNAEGTDANGIQSFDSAGFTLGSNDANMLNTTYVGWCWDAGSSTVTNTQGSISSQVRANASAGFSIVTYTGNGTNGATVGHGLGVHADLIIVKNRSAAADWPVSLFTSAELGMAWSHVMFLNKTDAQTDSPAGGKIRSGSSNTTTFECVTGSSNAVNVNTLSNDYVAYCFSAVAGYSAFGSYTGNGSTDGPFVYTGFKPKYVLVKGSSAVSDWWVNDSARSTYNQTANNLVPNSSAAEYTANDFNSIDILSNGFKMRNTNSSSNANGSTYIYAAFAEHPFQFSRAR